MTNRRRLATRCLSPLCLLSLVAALYASEETEDVTTIERLGWMEGSWAGSHDAGTWSVTYTSPDGGMILGVNKEIARGKVKMFEFEQFTQVDDDVILVPFPNGKQSVAFELTGFDPKQNKARFTNSDHDFPQEITYDGTVEGALTVVVGNPTEAGFKGFRIEMKRQ